MNNLDFFITQRNSSSKPLIIWGSAILAKKIAAFLKKRNIPFEGFAVNEKFYQKSKIGSVPVFKIEEYVKNNKCEVIIGFGGFKKNMLKDLKKENIACVYTIDFAGILVLDELNIWDKNFVSSHKKDILELKNSLQDQHSRQALDLFIKQKRTGCYTKKHDSNSLFDSSFIKYNSNECFVDCGAFWGDSSIDFIKAISSHDKLPFKVIYAIEPDSNNVKKLRETLHSHGSKIKVVETILGNHSGYAMFSAGLADQSRISEKGDKKIPVKKIDDIVKNEKISFIKMDIEGAELDALQGATETIKRNTPKLAISVYHRPFDLINIFTFLKNLNLGYKFYFRNYMPSGVDSILFAVK